MANFSTVTPGPHQVKFMELMKYVSQTGCPSSSPTNSIACLVSDCEIVKSITHYGIFFGRMASSIGCSVQHCCSKYGFTADDISCVSVKGIHRDFIEKANPGVINKARMLLELIFVRSGSLQVNLPCFESDVQFLICYLSTM